MSKNYYSIEEVKDALTGGWQAEEVKEGIVLIRDTDQVKARDIKDNGYIVYDINTTTDIDGQTYNLDGVIEVDCYLEFSKRRSANEKVQAECSRIDGILTPFRNRLRTSYTSDNKQVEKAEKAGKTFKTASNPKTGNIFENEKAFKTFLSQGFTGKELEVILKAYKSVIN